MGYYKIKQGVLQQNLSKSYHFESVEILCEEFNAIINERKKLEEKETEEDKYLWLHDSDERKYMTDSEILEKYINLDNLSCRSLVFSGTVHWFVGRQAFIHYCGLHQV